MTNRRKGLVNYSGNFEVELAAPLDARGKVDTVASLIDPLTWASNSGEQYCYKGMLTVVTDDPDDSKNGLYRLRQMPYTNADNWIFEGSAGTSGYTKAESDARFGSKTLEHTHENKTVLDSLTDDTGVLMYNGTPVVTKTKEISRELVFNNETEALAFNISDICDEEGILSVVSGFITIQANSNSNLKILIGSVTALNVDVPTNQSQGYKLLNSKTTFVYATGQCNLTLTILGYI